MPGIADMEFLLSGTFPYLKYEAWAHNNEPYFKTEQQKVQQCELLFDFPMISLPNMVLNLLIYAS